MNKPELVVTLAPTVARWVSVEWLVFAVGRAAAAASGRRLTLDEVIGRSAEAERWRASIEHEIGIGKLEVETVDGLRRIRLIDLVKWAAFRNVRVEQAELPGCQSFVNAAYQALHMKLANATPALSGERGRMAQQEEVILTTLRAMGYDPLNLPESKHGTGGVKQRVRNAAKVNKALFEGKSTFSNAWARLRADGRLGYATAAAEVY